MSPIQQSQTISVTPGQLYTVNLQSYFNTFGTEVIGQNPSDSITLTYYN
jgi:hypothetical protein